MVVRTCDILAIDGSLGTYAPTVGSGRLPGVYPSSGPPPSDELWSRYGQRWWSAHGSCLATPIRSLEAVEQVSGRVAGLRRLAARVRCLAFASARCCRKRESVASWPRLKTTGSEMSEPYGRKIIKPST
jgi:hypothetical protein